MSAERGGGGEEEEEEEGGGGGREGGRDANGGTSTQVSNEDTLCIQKHMYVHYATSLIHTEVVTLW